MHVHPAGEGVEPAGTGRALLIHAKTVATLFLEMEFDGLSRFFPAVDEAKAAIGEEGIIGGQRDEHWRGIGG